MRVKTSGIACVASVSVRFRSKERGTRVKHHVKNSASNPNHTPPPSVSFFGFRSIFCAAKTENPVPRAFFAPKPNGNACYAALLGPVSSSFLKWRIAGLQLTSRQPCWPCFHANSAARIIFFGPVITFMPRSKQRI